MAVHDRMLLFLFHSLDGRTWLYVVLVAFTKIAANDCTLLFLSFQIIFCFLSKSAISPLAKTLSVSLCLYVSLSVFVCFSVCLCLSVSLCVSLCICLCLSTSIVCYFHAHRSFHSLTTLQIRRLSGDRIEVFTIMKHFDNVDSSNLSILQGFTFRSHALKLFKPRCNLNVSKYFSNRVVDVWNRLDQSIIETETTSTLKHNLDKHLYNRGSFRSSLSTST